MVSHYAVSLSPLWVHLPADRGSSCVYMPTAAAVRIYNSPGKCLYMPGIPGAVRAELLHAQSRAPHQLRKDVDDDAAVGLVVQVDVSRADHLPQAPLHALPVHPGFHDGLGDRELAVGAVRGVEQKGPEVLGLLGRWRRGGDLRLCGRGCGRLDNARRWSWRRCGGGRSHTRIVLTDLPRDAEEVEQEEANGEHQEFAATEGRLGDAPGHRPKQKQPAEEGAVEVHAMQTDDAAQSEEYASDQRGFAPRR